MDRIKYTLSNLKSWPLPSPSATIVPEPDPELAIPDEPKITQPRIEDYPKGYPQYSALISSHDSFYTFRSFRRLRARLLLRKQDEINVLEDKLDSVDREERAIFFHGTCRGDENAEREKVLSQITEKLTEYDTLMEQSRQTMSYNQVDPQNVERLQNWLDKTNCLVDDEITYLEKGNDLITPAFFRDPAMSRLESWVEGFLIRHYKGFREKPGFGVSTDPDVYIYSGTLIKTIATILMLLLVVSLLLLPIVICIFVEDIPVPIVIIILATACFLAVLARLTKSKMIELIVAGATFATVLNVFVSNSN